MKTKLNFLPVIACIIFLFAAIGCEKDAPVADEKNECVTKYQDRQAQIKADREAGITQCKNSGGTPAGVEKCILDVNTASDKLDKDNMEEFIKCQKEK